MTVNTVGLRVEKGAGIGRDAGQEPLAQPADAGRQGRGGDRHGTRRIMTRRPRHGGEGYVTTRCLWGGARTVMPRCTLRGGKSAMTRHLWVPGVGPVVVHRSLRGEGSAMTRRLLRGARPVTDRHARRGARTAMTRRPGRGGQGYVMARRLWGGARTVMPRRTLRGGGSTMTRRLLRGARPVTDRHARRGARTAMTPAPSAGWLRHRRWLTRWYVCVPAGRCPVLQEGLASANPRQCVHIGGRWGKDNGLGGGRASPPGPLSTMWRGGAWLAPLWSPRYAGDGDSRFRGDDGAGGLDCGFRRNDEARSGVRGWRGS